MKIMCKSPNGLHGPSAIYDYCLVCKDSFQTNGGDCCCTMAEECDFNEERILKECEYAVGLI